MRVRNSLIWLTGLLMVSHFSFKLTTNPNSLLNDLFGFNLIAFACALIALTAPKINNRSSNILVALAIIIWSTGSLISSLVSFGFLELNVLIIDLCYAMFYPLVLFGLIIANSSKLKFGALELFDSAIISLGSASVLAALLLNPLLELVKFDDFRIFLSIFYICADIVLLIFTLLIAINSKLHLRTILLSTGLLAFVFSDLYFLRSEISGNYLFGQISDDGWLLGLYLVAIGMNVIDLGEKSQPRALNFLISFTLIASATLLGVAAIRPGYFPNFVLVPSFVTVVMSFVRMSLAIREARTASSERLLARTDELTTLANRRYFLKNLSETEFGFLMLIDLNDFKSVNDSFGHDVGDKVLKQVAQRFNRVVDSNSIIARLGGDEFGVITSADENSAEELVQALLATLSYPIVIQTIPFQIGASIGMTKIWPDQEVSEKLRQADLAMYRAKDRSRQLVEDRNRENSIEINQLKTQESNKKSNLESSHAHIQSSTWEKFEQSMDEKFFENRL